VRLLEAGQKIPPENYYLYVQLIPAGKMAEAGRVPVSPADADESKLK
jgi:hypothetical protein